MLSRPTIHWWHEKSLLCCCCLNKFFIPFLLNEAPRETQRPLDTERSCGTDRRQQQRLLGVCLLNLSTTRNVDYLKALIAKAFISCNCSWVYVSFFSLKTLEHLLSSLVKPLLDQCRRGGGYLLSWLEVGKKTSSLKAQKSFSRGIFSLE